MSIENISKKTGYIFLLVYLTIIISSILISKFNIDIEDYSIFSFLSQVVILISSVFILKFKSSAKDRFVFNFRNVQITATFIFFNLFIWLFLNYVLNITSEDYIKKDFKGILLILSAAVVEEYVFRYKIYNALKEHGILFAIVASSIVFATFHIERFYMAFFMGVSASLIYFYTRSIIYPILTNLFIESYVLFDLVRLIFRVDKVEILHNYSLAVPFIVCMFLMFFISFIVGMICGYYGVNDEMSVNRIKFDNDFKDNIKKFLGEYPLVWCVVFSSSVSLFYVIGQIF